jgi:hypothetical protein
VGVAEIRRTFQDDKKEQAEVWLDGTPEPNLETNDMKYAENFAIMPERIKK